MFRYCASTNKSNIPPALRDTRKHLVGKWPHLCHYQRSFLNNLHMPHATHPESHAHLTEERSSTGRSPERSPHIVTRCLPSVFVWGLRVLHFCSATMGILTQLSRYYLVSSKSRGTKTVFYKQLARKCA